YCNHGVSVQEVLARRARMRIKIRLNLTVLRRSLNGFLIVSCYDFRRYPVALDGLTRIAMSKKKIVVIEDEPDILEVLSYNLKREGFEVFAASDGIRGLALVRKETPDLVLLDLMLPGMDG